jgi:hypothetical protein
MKQKLFLLVALFSMFLSFSCSKSDDGPSEPAYASFDIGSQKFYTGTVITLTGRGFGTDTSKVKLTLDSRKMVITAMTSTSLTFTIPQEFLPSGQKDCTLEITKDAYSFQRQVMVYYLEPHGWFYATPIANYGSNSQIFTNLIFPTDSIGYATRYRTVYKSTDGGISWKGDGSNVGLGKAVASSDGKNVWIEFVASVGITTDGGANWKMGANGSSYNSQIIGLYTSGTTNGLVALTNGQLYDIDGNFTGAAVKYHSSFYTTGTVNLWQKMFTLDKNNLIIAGFSKNVVLEKGGVFTEVDISSVSSSATVINLQMVDANTAFLVNGNNELIKYDGNTWTKLTQQANAVYFTNTTTGFIAYNNKILKTTDGGATWKEEFTLNATDKVDVLCARNGKIWAFGNNSTQGFVVKYNP